MLRTTKLLTKTSLTRLTATGGRMYFPRRSQLDTSCFRNVMPFDKIPNYESDFRKQISPFQDIRPECLPTGIDAFTGHGLRTAIRLVTGIPHIIFQYWTDLLGFAPRMGTPGSARCSGSIQVNLRLVQSRTPNFSIKPPLMRPWRACWRIFWTLY